MTDKKTWKNPLHLESGVTLEYIEDPTGVGRVCILYRNKQNIKCAYGAETQDLLAEEIQRLILQGVIQRDELLLCADFIRRTGLPLYASEAPTHIKHVLEDVMLDLIAKNKEVIHPWEQFPMCTRN